MGILSIKNIEKRHSTSPHRSRLNSIVRRQRRRMRFVTLLSCYCAAVSMNYTRLALYTPITSWKPISFPNRIDRFGFRFRVCISSGRFGNRHFVFRRTLPLCTRMPAKRTDSPHFYPNTTPSTSPECYGQLICRVIVWRSMLVRYGSRPLRNSS